MIVGVGLDLEDIADFGRTLRDSGEAFLQRVYTEREVAYCQSQPHACQSYAVRYAAKEAAMKALGIAGLEGLKWRDFEIVATPGGAPELLLSGLAAATAKRLQVQRLVVSLTHSRSTAGAVVVAEGGESPVRPVRTKSKRSIRRSPGETSAGKKK